jgi:hypothetical protein
MQHKHKHKHHAITQHKHKHNDVTTKRTQTVQSQATCCFVVDHGDRLVLAHAALIVLVRRVPAPHTRESPHMMSTWIHHHSVRQRSRHGQSSQRSQCNVSYARDGALVFTDWRQCMCMCACIRGARVCVRDLTREDLGKSRAFTVFSSSDRCSRRDDQSSRVRTTWV